MLLQEYFKDIKEKYFKDIKYWSICYVFLFLVLLFQNPIGTIIPGLGIADELFPWGILIFSITIYHIKYQKNFIKELFSKESIRITIPLIIILILGLMGNIVYGYQSTIPIIADILTVFKGFLTYLFLTNLVKIDIVNINKDLIINVTKITIIFLFFLLILNIFVPFFNSSEIRYGIPSQMLFFTHPTYLATAAVTLLCILSLDEKGKNNIPYYFLITTVILSTQRSKAIIFIFIYYALRYIVINKNKRLNLKIIVVVGIICLSFCTNKIIEYLSNPDWARTALMTKSVLVAVDHFPFGSGFSTFGTWYSGVYYSPLYSMYNLNQIWGLTSYDYSFLGDTYWPAILGQFGFIGLGISIYILFQIYRDICMYNDIYNYFSKLLILIYLLILSTSETSFMSPVAVLLCVILAI